MKIKRFIHSIRDWIRQWLQTIALVGVIPAMYIFNVAGQMFNLLKAIDIPLKELAVEYRISLGLGNTGLGIILFFLLLLFIRKCNKGQVLKQNTKEIAWHTFAGYWYCCRILNYRTISLTRVPIPIQIKLVFNNLFDEYLFMDGVTELEGPDNIRVESLRDYDDPTVVNVFLADTYPINEWKSKLPVSAKLHQTIIVDRSSEERGRYFSKEYVSKIRSTILDLPKNVDVINLFATINAAHCYHITKEVFMTGGSDHFKLLRVFEQNKQTWQFDGEYRDIKLK